MRAALETIQQIEQYLLNDMSQADKLAFEAEMNANLTLKSQVDSQQQLIEGIKRMGLKSSAIKARSKYQLRKWLIRTAIVLALITLSSFTYIYFSQAEDCVPCENEIHHEGTEAVMDQNCCPQSETSLGPVETVPESGSEIIEEDCEEEILTDSVELIDQIIESNKDEIIEEGADVINSNNDTNDLINANLIPNVEFNENGNSTISTNNRIGAVSLNATEQPRFPGGEVALMKWLSENTIYPQSAIDQNLSGTVHVGFIVNEQGKVVNTSVKKSAHPILNQAAIATVKNMPDWIPAEYQGEKIPVAYTLPIVYKSQ